MFVTIDSAKWRLLILLVFMMTPFAGCKGKSFESTATVERAPTFTLSPVSTITHSSPVVSTCTPIPNGHIYVIDEAIYGAVDAGIEFGPLGAIGVLQKALEEHHPEWSQEEDLAKYVWNSSHTQNIGVNPRVLLVTAGISMDWQVPENSNLLEDISRAGVALTQHYREFRFNEELQANYPQLANAESYALYAFFDFDLEKLDTWQQEYDRMFGDIQPRISPEGCETINQNK